MIRGVCAFAAAAVCVFVFAGENVAKPGVNLLKAQKPGFSLAREYRPESGDFALGEYWVSEKYDGVRAFWDGRRLVSRGGKVFAAPEWFTAGFPAARLDGELWAGRGKFEYASGTVRRKKPHEGWRKIRYMVFDLPEHGGVFRERYAKLEEYAADSENKYWSVVEQKAAGSSEELEMRFAKIVGEGGEGLMLRRIESLHRVGRSDDLLKYKPFADAEAVVIGHNPGKGKYAGMTGSLRARALADGKEFSIGSGLKDAQRKNPPPVGATVTYKHQGFTENGIPRFPVFLRTRNEEPE